MSNESGNFKRPELSEILERFLEELESEEFDPQSRNYEFFRTEEERDELVFYCTEVAKFLYENKIPDIIIVDRSSRPLYVGLTEFWKRAYPDEPLPNIYFMNPKGFNSKENASPGYAKNVAANAIVNGDAYEDADQVRPEAEIKKELKERYFKLMKDKDKPVLVFDSCLHTGNTLAPVIDTLESLGFSNLLVGSVNPSDRQSIIQTDFYITQFIPTKTCYPFDQDRMIEKTFDHVFSKVNPDPHQRTVARRLRDEIREIMKESFEERTPAE